MGTNYYMTYNICDSCGRSERVHIGKSGRHVQGFKKDWPDEDYEDNTEPFKSLGEITSWRDWKRVIAANPDCEITSEYGEVMTFGDLQEIFEGTPLEARARQHRGYKQFYSPGTIWLDEDGFTVSTGDFS